MNKLPRTAVSMSCREDITNWLSSSEVDAYFLADDLKYALALLDIYEPGKQRVLSERRELGELSWLGGPALGPLKTWPRNHDGEALAHIATIFLPEAQAMMDSPDYAGSEWPEPGPRLPATGYLEIFHHLGTYGNPEDEGTGGWLVRHVPFDGENFPPLIDAPSDLDLPEEFCQPVLLGGGFSVPRPADFIDSSNDHFTKAELVAEEMDAAFTALSQGVEHLKGPVFPISRLYGHSYPGTTYAHEVLNEARPLTGGGDSYVLVFSAASWVHFDDWFADAGTFELWMRGSDLTEGRFDNAWCMIRTD